VAPRDVLPGAVEPEPFESLLAKEGANGGDAWPVSQLLDKPFLTAMRQDVSKSLDLGCLFLADGNGLIPTAPELLSPMDQPAGFAGQVGIEMAHKKRQIVGGLHLKEEMEVVARKGESTDTYGVELLRPAESAEDNLIELIAGGEEKAALDGPAGDLDEAAPLGR
jgi:hypothetical protein